MSVEADFKFVRSDNMGRKGHSFDIKACKFRETRARKCYYHLQILAECKYRRDGKTWLFFPDLNEDLYLLIPGATISAIDQFSSRDIKIDELVNFEENLPIAYKIVELHEKGADSADF